MQNYSDLLFEIIFPLATSIFAVWAVVAAKNAMAKGLTYSTMAVTVWTLIILAIARVWHLMVDILNLKSKFGESVEVVEYTLYLLGYIIFIWVSYRSSRAKSPN